MKALYITEPGKTEIREIAKPVRKSGEALLKVLSVGICGSDLGSYRGTFAYFDYPRIPGHEFSAEIVEIDDNDYGLTPGMIVTANPYFNCGKCYSCTHGHVNACMDNKTMGCQMDGAFCEYVSMPIERIIDGKGLNPDTLALIEPFCIGYHGALRANVKKGDKVLIIGAGTIGVMAGISAKSMGAEVYLSDVIEDKLAKNVKDFGFDGMIFNSSKEAFLKEVEDITGYTFYKGEKRIKGFDTTIEAVGMAQTFQDAIDACCFGGNVCLVGVSRQKLDFDFTIIQKKELNIYGSRNAMTSDFKDLIDLVSSGKVDLSNMITNTYVGIENAPKAFSDFSENRSHMLKVMVEIAQPGFAK